MTDEEAARLRAAERAHAAHDAAVAAGFAPLVAMSADILKAVSFINGGAAVATLLFVAETIRDRPALSGVLVLPLAMFGFGLAVAAFATGWSYLSQERLALAAARRETSWLEPFIRDTDASREADRQGLRFRGLAMAAVFVSMGSAVGGFSAAGIILLRNLG